MKKIMFISVVLVLLTGTGFAEVLKVVPDSPDLTRNYLFYLHGRIVEGSDGRPITGEIRCIFLFKIHIQFYKRSN